MKKHELIKQAYDKYPNGTKIYSTSGNGTSHKTQTPYLIDECGSVQDNYGWLIYYKGIDKWAEIVTEEIKPLLISEDGVPLFEGDKIYIAYQEIVSKIWAIWTNDKGNKCKITNRNVVILYPDKHKAFSSLEAAEKWIEENNKPKEIEVILFFGIYASINAEKSEVKIMDCDKEACKLSFGDINDLQIHISKALKQLQS